VHRDLSLENVLVITNKAYVRGKTPKLRPCICDFGLAVESNEKNLTRKVGKWSYMSLECWQGNYNGKANDIWTLGVMLTMMLIGAPPYAQILDRAYELYGKDTKSLKSLFRQYKRDHMIAEDVYEVLDGISSKESDRMTIDQVLATKYCQNAPYRDYRDCFMLN
jgi:serine/threonine protein kinase